ncbi:arginine--tRNA ligase [Candidatus Woesearchaeota archaeon]|jgi:arginyl-tRNA synthetase|nr:arginine--tRNA ligase [Candidatus Woesearchaeota archaeon]
MFKQHITKVLKKETKLKEIPLEIPPNPEFGDYAFPCFILSKKYKKDPVQIAQELAKKIKPDNTIKEIRAIGPYLNFFTNREQLTSDIIKQILKEKDNYGKAKKTNKKIIVEYPGPNTNKPLHLGHVRNMVSGYALCKILEENGNKVIPVNINNDRGIHICKSMLAYQKFGKNDSPAKSKLKSDFFVGKYYVLFAKKVKSNPNLEQEAKELLQKWEQGDKKTIALWKKMNSWAFEGFKHTYKTFDIKFKKEYFESNTYKKGKDIIYDGLKKRLFEKDKTGAITIDLTKQGLDEKILLRSDGTAVYITQDIYLAKKRYDDFKYDKLIYVVATEQNYHFKVLFEVLKKLKFPFADRCYHFAYGMVNLTTGKMKSREGNVVDADNLVNDLTKLAEKAIQKRHKKISKKELDKRSKSIALSAIRFYMLKHDPIKDFIFDPKKSISFEGETGPYIQYTHARINSIIKKSKQKVDKAHLYLLTEPTELLLAKKLNEFPQLINKIGENYKLSLMCHYLLDLCQEFNTYYHSTKIIQENKELESARLSLIYAIKEVIKKGLTLLGIEALEEM